MLIVFRISSVRVPRYTPGSGSLGLDGGKARKEGRPANEILTFALF